MTVATITKVIPLAEADPAMADRIGNKAAGLAELARAGFSVPKGFCIPVDAFTEWRESGDIAEATRRQILDAFAELRAPVAVRSSSPAEDRADASFAGQYETILGVRTPDELLDAVVACWRSATSTAATAYRLEHDTPVEAAMAVLVQELVPATAAGVLFTLHPVTNRVDQVVVNSNFGIGDSVVSGRVEPDTFILEKTTGRLVEAQRGSKRAMSRMGDRAVEDVPTIPEQQSQLSLSEAQLARLTRVAAELEAHFDQPMDAEWAFEGDVLWMLQARPITTGIHAFLTWLLDEWARERGLEDEPDAVWSRGSPISSLPTSPLYYSEMAAFFSDMFPDVARLHGAQSPKRKNFRYFNGFTYTNRAFSSTADPSGTLQPLSLLSPAWRSTLRLGFRNPRSLAIWTNIDRYYRNWREKWGPEIEARRPDYSMADTGKIRDFIEFIEAQRRERSLYAACAVGYASDLLGLLLHLLKRWAPGASEETIGLLTSGVEGSLTHEENLEVWRLAEVAARDSDVRGTVEAGRFDELEGMPQAREFLQAVDAVRARRPHRGCSDRDLFQRRWGDSRESLLDQVSNMLRLGESANPAVAHRATVERRKALENQLSAQIGRGPMGPLRLAIFRKVLRATQRYWMQRDNQRHTFDRYFYELRRAYKAMGRRLAEQGALDEPDAVFFAGKTEIYAHLDGDLPAERLRQRARLRRQWWSDVTTKEPFPLLQGEQPFDDGAGGAEGADLKGTGGSPGSVTGPVRLVRSMQELRDVQPGEIVVTQAIDPAWTPIFGIIGGVISEEGGMLSHATVLGREYGLPVVIGAVGATRLLQTGEMVAVNGTTGAVRRVEPETVEPA